MSTIVELESGTGVRRVTLEPYLDAAAAEQCMRDANAWIKALRLARVDGETFRGRFRHRGDSLWWFAELYLHKRGLVARVHRVLAALEALVERERPLRLRLVQGDAAARLLAPQIAMRCRFAYEGPRHLRGLLRRQRTAAELRSALYAAAPAAGRLRTRRPPPRPSSARPLVAAFVHGAFWRRAGSDEGEEGYIGPVLRALASSLAPGGLQLIGVGPSTNFRARRWWHPVLHPPGPEIAWTPVERYAPWGSFAEARRVWRDRHAHARALTGSGDLREAAQIRGYDGWPLLREELWNIALLQFPWSARVMDEAAAALDAVRPDAVVTYAEAGGWGRAIVLEARRRAIPVAGLQHGFIYRHWLNYLHEPDEMKPIGEERGFPRPDLTLVYDGYAAQHLARCGRFPAASVAVTGSPQLDALVSRSAALTDADIANARREAGAARRQLVLVVSKYNEIRGLLESLVRAAAELPDAQIAIKCHPADTSLLYERATKGAARVAVLPASADLAALLGAARALVTVNSTVALDALTLGIPALVVGLPNNLSPFVEAGAMAGAEDEEQIGRSLHRLLYDEDQRARLAAAGRAFLDQHGIASSGRAAERAAEAVLGLIRSRPPATDRRQADRPGVTG
jgi:UDP-N-acetylglucosamine 2-epimerase